MIVIAASFAWPFVCGAQSVGVDLQSPFSMTWTVQMMNVPTQRADSNGDQIVSSKLLSVRATARDLRLGLLSDGQIAGPLSGWKVVARTNDREAANANYTLFAVKRGKDPVEIKAGSSNGVMTLTPISSGPFVAHARLRNGDVVKASGIAQLYLSGSFFLAPVPFTFTGMANQPFTISRRTVDGVTTATSVPGTVKISIHGLGFLDTESGPFPFSMRGGISMGPHRVTASYLY